MLSKNHTRNSRTSLTDRIRSGYHRFWYEASQTLRWSRGTFREAPAGLPQHLTNRQLDRIYALGSRYHISFEKHCPPETALLNYAYLDVLDQARDTLGWTVPQGLNLCDVGSANFAYAQAIHSFFQPSQLTGVEVDGHRIYCNGRSRIDYAEGHIQDLPHTRYVVEDFRRYLESADIITAWYPFVTPKPLLAWRLPLSLFNPGAFFTRVANNLTIGGLLVMVNHSSSEAKIARDILESVGLICTGQFSHDNPLTPRTHPSILTLWHHT